MNSGSPLVLVSILLISVELHHYIQSEGLTNKHARDIKAAQSCTSYTRNALRGKSHSLEEGREAKEQIFEKQSLLPTERAFLPAVGGRGHTALGHLTPPFLQVTVLQVQIQNFKTQHA